MTTPDYREQAAEVWRAIGEDPNMHLAPNATAMMHLASWASRIAEERLRSDAGVCEDEATFWEQAGQPAAAQGCRAARDRLLARLPEVRDA